VKLRSGFDFEELRRRQRATRETGDVNRALEVVDLIDPHADRGAARFLRREANLDGAFLPSVHIVPELMSVVYSRDVVPRPQPMEALAIDQRVLRITAVTVAVQAPLAVDDTDFEEHPVLGAFLLQMEPALCLPASIGPENRLPRKRLGSCERMHVDEQRIVDAVEFDRPADRRVDDARVAENSCTMTADSIQSIERPQFDAAAARCGSL
jgi:hypothetical protein